MDGKDASSDSALEGKAMIVEILLGATMSVTSGLGYSRPSFGFVGDLRVPYYRMETSILSSSKLDGGQGFTLTGLNCLSIPLIRRPSSTSFWTFFGIDWGYGHYEKYNSSRISPYAEIAVEKGGSSAGLYWVGKGQKIDRILGVRLRYFSGAGIELKAERVTHTLGEGTRIELKGLWRIR